MRGKSIVVAIVFGVLVIAGLPTITTALNRLGVIPIAQSIHAEYLTGTALAVILALLFLLPSTYRISTAQQSDQCPVCDRPLRHRGRYCPACGSRVRPR